MRDATGWETLLGLRKDEAKRTQGRNTNDHDNDGATREEVDSTGREQSQDNNRAKGSSSYTEPDKSTDGTENRDQGKNEVKEPGQKNSDSSQTDAKITTPDDRAAKEARHREKMNARDDTIPLICIPN